MTNNLSFWHRQKLSIPKPHRNLYDIVIVGAGIAGLSTAYWLQKKDKNLKIAIIEKNFLGFGATGRNAGFLTCGSVEHFIKLDEKFGLAKAVEIWKFSENNHTFLAEEIIQDNGVKLDYKKTGSCTVAPTVDRWIDYKRYANIMKQNNIQIEQITDQDMQLKYGITGFSGGLNYLNDGYVDPVKLLHEIWSQLKNVDLYEDTEVLKVESDHISHSVQTKSFNLESTKVFLTLNAYLPLINPEYSKLITPGRGQILLTKPLPEFVQGPCYLTQHLCYFRQLPTGHLLIGGFRNLAVDIENTYEDTTTDLIQAALLDFVKSHFKFGPQAEVEKKWSGVMGFSPDGQMLIGQSKSTPGLHIVAGCSGHGMGLSFHAAKVLVENAFGAKDIPVHLNLHRFL